jgi:hypothetical protein
MDDGRPKGGITGSLSVGRPAVVLALFVVAVAILVAVGTRPSVSGVPSSAQTTLPTTTTTTAPGAATTTTAAAAASTTTTAAGHHRRGAHATTTTTTIAPASVSVVVANATSTTGLAAHYTTVIGGTGYQMKTPIDATTSETTSAVYYASGFQQPAAAIATAVGVKPTQVLPLTSAAPVSGVTGIDVVVVIGSDLAATAAS